MQLPNGRLFQLVGWLQRDPVLGMLPSCHVLLEAGLLLPCIAEHAESAPALSLTRRAGIECVKSHLLDLPAPWNLASHQLHGRVWSQGSGCWCMVQPLAAIRLLGSQQACWWSPALACSSSCLRTHLACREGQANHSGAD